MESIPTKQRERTCRAAEAAERLASSTARLWPLAGLIEEVNVSTNRSWSIWICPCGGERFRNRLSSCLSRSRSSSPLLCGRSRVSADDDDDTSRRGCPSIQSTARGLSSCQPGVNVEPPIPQGTAGHQPCLDAPYRDKRQFLAGSSTRSWAQRTPVRHLTDKNPSPVVRIGSQLRLRCRMWLFQHQKSLYPSLEKEPDFHALWSQAYGKRDGSHPHCHVHVTLNHP